MKPKSLPNILYIHSHDTGRYIQPFGYAVPTPNLQKLAEQGVLFRNAYCTSPGCSPSRASLLTGMYPHSNGMLGLAHRGFSLNDYSRVIVNVLREYGYTSTMCGIQHIDGPTIDRQDYGKRIGYDNLPKLEADGNIYGPESIEQRAANFLTSKPKQPFFLDVGFFETHRPFPTKTNGVDERYVMPPAYLPDMPATRSDFASYLTAAKCLDEKIGYVLNALESSNLVENTLVLCTTDHGIAFPRMKVNLTDSGTGVFLILKGPEAFWGGKVIDGLVSHIDIYPTLCETLNIKPPSWLQGVSLMPLVREDKDQVRKAVFMEVNHHVDYEPQRGVRTQRWKYVLRFGKNLHPSMPNCDDSPSKQLWRENEWESKEWDRTALYDLVFDPQELNNLADHPDYEHIRAEMHLTLKNWMRDTKDPLLAEM